MRTIWPLDPTNNKPSVSLALLILSTACVVGTITRSWFDSSEPMSLVMEFWTGTAALYFGRRTKWSKSNGLDVGENSSDKSAIQQDKELN